MTFQFYSSWTLSQAVFGSLAVLAAAALAGKPEKHEQEKRRIEEIDFAKGIAILSVILLHVPLIVGGEAQPKDVLSFGVEMFILVSGYLLCTRYADGVDLREYWKGIAQRIVLPYAAFTLVSHLVFYGSLSLPSLALDLLFGRANGGSLYFIPLILQFYLLFPLLLRARRLLSGPLGLVLLYSACAFMSFWDWQVRQPDWNSNLPALIFFGRYTFYFVFGMFLAGFSPESWSAKRLAGFALLFLLSVAAQSVAVGQFFIGQNYALAAFFASLSLAAVLKGAAPRVFSAVRQMGKDSLWIYFVHPLAIYLAQGIVPLKDGVIAYAEDALAAIALSCASVWAAHRVLGRAKGQAGSAAVPPASA